MRRFTVPMILMVLMKTSTQIRIRFKVMVSGCQVFDPLEWGNSESGEGTAVAASATTDASNAALSCRSVA